MRAVTEQNMVQTFNIHARLPSTLVVVYAKTCNNRTHHLKYAVLTM